MRFRFDLDGDAYSEKKEAFKRILAKHGLRWKGTLDRPLWASPAEKVTAVFDRDQEKDILRHASLVWEGRTKSKLLEDLKAWIWEIGGKAEEEKGPAVEDVSEDVERALHFWDIVYEPNVDALRAQGRPDSWIEEDVRRWKRQRRTRQRELLGRAMD
ncbi:MAG TPA: hypothetical protein VIB49_05100 [Thermoplasmata archaeon]|jgi:hypothetical protein